MSTERDTTRIVRSWLEDGPSVLPDRVLDDVLSQLPTTPQRRHLWSPRRATFVTNTMKIGLVSAAVLAVIVVATGLYFSQSSEPGPAAPTGSIPATTAAPAPSQSPTHAPTPRSGSSLPVLSGELSGGTYLVMGPPGLNISVTVPGGWAGNGWALFGPETGDAQAPAMGFWKVLDVYADPLNPDAGFLNVGPTVDDLASALAGHDGWSASDRTAVELDGWAGQRLELRVPADIQFESCGAASSFNIWSSSNGRRCSQAPGEIDEVYILDVEGERLVISLVYGPETPQEQVEALRTILNSASISRR